MNKGAPHSSANMTDLGRLVDSKHRSAKRMSGIDENKPKSRSGQRKAKAKQPGSKDEQRQRARTDQELNHSDRVEAVAALDEAPPVETDTLPKRVEIEAVALTGESLTDSALVPIGPAPIVIGGPVETVWTGFQTMAHAYRRYAWRSIEDSIDLAEKLTLARSLDKTVEIRNEFTRKACDGFLDDSQRVWRFYSEFTRQVFRSFERLLVWRTPVAR